MTSEHGPPGRDDANDLVLALYHELLQRAPAPSEQAEWRDALLRGMSLAAMRQAFLGSEEYRRNAAAGAHQAAIDASGLFDAAWYRARYPDVVAAGLDPLAHYCRFGAAEQRQPNAYFDPGWYAAQAAVAPDASLLLDYARRGEAVGIAPGPHFDPAWYRAAYAIDAATSPLAHFLAHRSSRAFAPCARLWSVARPAAAADPTDDDPFLACCADFHDPLQSAAADIGVLRGAGLFDENHYQIINDDVFSAGMDMLTHYCAFGWREHRNPNFYFDTRWYLATNPQVARLQLNPLVHYLLAGEAADRRPTVFFEPAWYRRTYGLPADQSPLAHYLAHRRTQAVSPNSLFDPAFYRLQCSEPPPARRDLFAHYLIAGMRSDVRPSAAFDAASWRRQTRGRPSRHFRAAGTPEQDNPLVTYLLAHYR